MATFRAALSHLSALRVAGVQNSYDIHELPNALTPPQLPALLVMPIEPSANRLFKEPAAGLQTVSFSGAAKTVQYTVTHLLLVAPTDSGLGIRSHLPRLTALIDSYMAAVAADVTLGGVLLEPTRVGVEPGIFPFDRRGFYGCAFRHAWRMEI